MSPIGYLTNNPTSWPICCSTGSPLTQLTDQLSHRGQVELRMELNESARNLIGKGADATLVTLNADGSPP